MMKKSVGKNPGPVVLEPRTFGKTFDTHTWLGFGIVIMAALAIRVGYWATIHTSVWFSAHMVDSKNYYQWAQSILNGDILGQGVFLHSPLYAFFLAGIFKLLGSTQAGTAAAAQLLVLGPVACGMVYLLGKKTFSTPVGLIAGLTQAFYAPAFFQEANLLTTLLIHSLNLLALLGAYWAMERKRWYAWIVPGIWVGLSVLTRPNAILFAVVIGIWIWVMGKPRRLYEQGPALAALFLSVCLMLIPPVVRNAVVLHETLLSVGNGGLNFYLGNKRTATGYHIPERDLGLSASRQVQEAKQMAEDDLGKKLTYGESSRYWTHRAWQEIGSAPGRWLGLLGLKTLRLFNDYEYTTSLNYWAVRARTPYLRWPWLSFGLLAPLALLGMWLARRQWKKLLPLYGLAAVYVITNVGLLVSAEYRFGLLPAFFIFAGFALFECLRAWQQGNWRVCIQLGGGFILLTALCYLPLVPTWVQTYHRVTAFANFGAMYAQLGDFPRAATEYQSAIRLVDRESPYAVGLHVQLGKVYLNTERPDLSLAPLEFAYARQPENLEAASILANALTAVEQYPRALELRHEVIQKAPDNPEYWVNLGITLLWVEKDTDAEQAFRKALALDPSIQVRLDETRETIFYYRKQNSLRK